MRADVPVDPTASEPDPWEGVMQAAFGAAPAGAGTAVRSAFERLYHELRALAQSCLAGERSNHPLQATALVHEAYLRLHRSGDDMTLEPGRFFKAAAASMRRILIDHARRETRQKRGGGRQRMRLDALELAATGDQTTESWQSKRPSSALAPCMRTSPKCLLDLFGR